MSDGETELCSKTSDNLNSSSTSANQVQDEGDDALDHDINLNIVLDAVILDEVLEGTDSAKHNGKILSNTSSNGK